jgi:gamma-glutamylaminecyclotransferase
MDKIEIPARPHLLMVYGTLKRGMGNDVILDQTDSIFHGESLTRDKYVVADGGFPRLAKIPPGDSRRLEPYAGRVRGELWCLTDEGLAACDKLEGHPRFYVREEVEVMDLEVSAQTRKPHYLKAWLYVIKSYPVAASLLTPNDEGVLEWK